MISVIIPIYNAACYLRRTAACIRSQSFSDFEVLLINDGSLDNSERICQELEQTDRRFRTISQPNSGVSAARNRGLQEAKGEYITFLDADDTIPENYFAQLYQALEKSHAQMSVCDVAVVENDKETGRFTCKTKELTQPEALNLLLCRKEINSGPYAKLFRRDVVADLRFPPLKAYEDILFIVDAVCHCQKIAATDLTEYHYAQNPSGAMGNFRKMPSLDVVVATRMLAEQINLRKDLSPNCLYTTLSHLMQYALPLIGNPDPQAASFVAESQQLIKSQIGPIRKCAAFPWKEKIVFLLFAHGWQYTSHRIKKI